MTFAFMVLYWLASIILWVSILTILRAKEVKKDMGLVLSLVLSIVFLMIIIRLTLHAPLYYLVGAVGWSVFSIAVLWRGPLTWKRAMGAIIDFLFWPQALCFAMFIYGVSDAEQSA